MSNKLNRPSTGMRLTKIEHHLVSVAQEFKNVGDYVNGVVDQFGLEFRALRLHLDALTRICNVDKDALAKVGQDLIDEARAEDAAQAAAAQARAEQAHREQAELAALEAEIAAKQAEMAGDGQATN